LKYDELLEVPLKKLNKNIMRQAHDCMAISNVSKSQLKYFQISENEDGNFIYIAVDEQIIMWNL